MFQHVSPLRVPSCSFLFCQQLVPFRGTEVIAGVNTPRIVLTHRFLRKTSDTFTGVCRSVCHVGTESTKRKPIGFSKYFWSQVLRASLMKPKGMSSKHSTSPNGSPRPGSGPIHHEVIHHPVHTRVRSWKSSQGWPLIFVPIQQHEVK